jgi:hypothetical protein
LTDGNLPGPITNAVTVSGTSVSGDNVTLNLSAAKGTFKGSFVNPSSNAKKPFAGVFLQNQNFGSGYFLGTTESGRVFFGPGN